MAAGFIPGGQPYSLFPDIGYHKPMPPFPPGQTLLIDADDTLWENNIYFERAIAAFISFLITTNTHPKKSATRSTCRARNHPRPRLRPQQFHRLPCHLF